MRERFISARLMNALRGAAVLLLAMLFLAGPGPLSSGRLQAYAGVSGQDIVDYALSYVGKVPYKWGGKSFSSGMDCSGFVCGVYDHFGINLWSYRTKIRNSPLVTNAGADITLANAGDILWFEGHVAIYTGIKNGEPWMVNETKGTYNGITDNVIYSPVRIHRNAFENLRGVLKVKGVDTVCSHNWTDQGVKEAPTALSEGTMTCVCTKCGATATRSIAKLTPTLTLNASSITLKTGQGFQVAVSGMAEGDYPTQIRSSNGYVALVNEYGQILSNNPGSAIVTITLASGKTGQIYVTVIPSTETSGSSGSTTGSTAGSGSGSASGSTAGSGSGGTSGSTAGSGSGGAGSSSGTSSSGSGKVTAIKVSGKSTVAAGKKITLKASVTVTDNAPSAVRWTTSRASIARVTASGVVIGRRPGKAVIKAISTDGNKVIGKKTIVVVPKKVTTFKAKALSGRRIKLTWKKPGTLSGYQIQYSRSAKFMNARTKWVSSSKKTIRVRVPKKKKYYFRIRPYVKVGSKKYYGTWSKKISARAISG